MPGIYPLGIKLEYPPDFQWLCAYCGKHQEDCKCADDDSWVGGFAPGCCICINDRTCACGGAALEDVHERCRCKPVLEATLANRVYEGIE